VGASGGVTVDDVVISAVFTIEPTPVPVAGASSLFPSEPPNPVSPRSGGITVQSFGTGPVLFKYVSDVPGFQSAITEANQNTNNIYVIRMQPGSYAVNQITLTGQVMVIGNMAQSVNDSAVPDAQKVIFRPSTTPPATGNSVLFFVSTNGARLALHNVVLEGVTGSGPGSGGGVYNWGETYIYSSLLRNLKAVGWGSAVYNGGNNLAKLEIVNTVLQGNQITGSGYSNPLGGTVASEYGATVSIACSTFKNNNSVAYAGALFIFASSGTVTLNQGTNSRNNNFENNTAALGNGAIRNENTVIQNATNQYWNPAPSTTQSAPNSVLNTDTSSPLSSLVGPCSVPPIPTPVAAGSRNVHANASAFHAQAQPFGLPMPFDRLPYNVNQTGQSNANDPLQINSTAVPQQGFGPSTISYLRPTYYTQTFGIHSGLDYGGNTWVNRVVVSICDGVVIRGNWYQGGTNTGGSAQPGTGLSVRCFLDRLDSGRSDINGDGKPELSNIVVTYNHLLPDPPSIDRTIDCSLVDIPGCSGEYDLPRPIFQDSDATSLCTDITQCVGDVVLVGEVLGQTTFAFDFDHLHLAIFLARGYFRPGGNNNAFYLNPLLMYTAPVVAQHRVSSYFPNQRDGSQISDSLGIDRTDLSEWSAGGWNFYPNGNVETNTFWRKQTPTPSGPSRVEWPHDNYPNIPANNASAITDLIEYLTQSFNSYPYTAPSCVIFSDQSRIPLRIRARCDQSDTRNDGVYNVVSHPGN